MFCSLQVDIDVNDTPDEEEVKNDAKNQKSVKLGVLKQRQKVFEEIRALGGGPREAAAGQLGQDAARGRGGGRQENQTGAREKRTGCGNYRR